MNPQYRSRFSARQAHSTGMILWSPNKFKNMNRKSLKFKQFCNHRQLRKTISCSSTECHFAQCRLKTVFSSKTFNKHKIKALLLHRKTTSKARAIKFHKATILSNGRFLTWFPLKLIHSKLWLVEILISNQIQINNSNSVKS